MNALFHDPDPICTHDPSSPDDLYRRAAHLAHDLRSPVQRISAAASLLRSRNPTTQATLDPQRLLDVIDTSCTYMQRLLSDLLEVATNADGALPLRPSPVELLPMASQCLTLVEALAAERHLALRLDIEPSLRNARVHVDATRLQQVLVNLLSNAIRFTDHGAVVLKIAQDPAVPGGAAAAGGGLRFEVRDTGTGMSADDLAVLAACLAVGGRQAPAAVVHRNGCGLGLMGCQRILRSMRSVLRLQSTVGAGTRACFTLLLGPQPGPAGTRDGRARGTD